MTRWLSLLVVLLALAVPAAALADGDPASDYLYTGSLFLPFDGSIPSASAGQLRTLIADAKKQGYEIRVAVIAKPDDLGAVTSLWAKPKDYARFLGTELGIVYKGPVLIVMPNGIGFYHANHNTTPDYTALKTIHSGSGNQLASAATASIATLARQAGHPFTPHTIAATQSANSRTTLLTRIAIVLVALVAVAAFVLHRRRRHP
jgi:hypothetical protein